MRGLHGVERSSVAAAAALGYFTTDSDTGSDKKRGTIRSLDELFVSFKGGCGGPVELSLKCDPKEAEALRQLYPAVKLGYHLNKRHWNTVTLDGTVDDELVLEWLDGSYERVVAGLTRRDREALTAREDGAS